MIVACITNYRLKPVTIDNAKPRDTAYALTDGGGLLLEVLPSGTKTWRYKHHLNGKREKVTIGANNPCGSAPDWEVMIDHGRKVREDRLDHWLLKDRGTSGPPRRGARGR